jgi:hypothetical protein
VRAIDIGEPKTPGRLAQRHIELVAKHQVLRFKPLARLQEIEKLNQEEPDGRNHHASSCGDAVARDLGEEMEIRIERIGGPERGGAARVLELGEVA